MSVLEFNVDPMNDHLAFHACHPARTPYLTQSHRTERVFCLFVTMAAGAMQPTGNSQRAHSTLRNFFNVQFNFHQYVCSQWRFA